MPGRRTILRGALAAGFTGAAGGLVLPRSAQAATARPGAASTGAAAAAPAAVPAAAPVPTLLSLNKPATASSVLSAAYPAAAAFDADPATRWASRPADPQWIQVDLGRPYSVTKVLLSWGADYASAYQLQLSVDGVHWTVPYSVAQDVGGTETPINNDASSGFEARYVRVYGTVSGTQNGYSLGDFQVWGVPYIAEPPGSLAQGKAATASSIENAHFPASAAFDGDLSTRWSSQFSDAQWLQVDLGQLYTVTSYKLLWEAAYAVEYGILTSADGSTWQEQFSTSSGYGGDVIAGSSGYPPVRYVRMEAAKRGTRYGYSLWEFAVYGG